MTYSIEEYNNKLIKELKLHDSEIRGIMFKNNKFVIEVSCKGMNIGCYFKGIEDVIISFCITDVLSLSFDFMDSIIINDFTIEQKKDKYIFSINNKEDLYIESLNYTIEFKEHKEYNQSYKKLDEILKSNK